MTLRSKLGWLILGLLVASATAAFAQTEEDQVKAVLTSLGEAASSGDTEAIGQALSDTGFVAVVGMADEAMVLTKEQMLAMPTTSGISLDFQDVKVSTHWMVALVSAKAVPAGMPAAEGFVFDGIMMREAGKWKFASVCIMADPGEASEDDVKAFVDRVAALPDSMKQGNTDSLDKAVNDERFVLAFVDPSLEFRWAASKTMFVQMIQSVIPMVTVDESRLDVSRTVVGPSTAIVDGTWLLDITDFGQTNSAIRAYAVKVNDEWELVALGGGPAK